MANTTGKKYGGRKKGTPNKKTLDVVEKLKSLNCDPIEGLARIALDSEEESLRLQANKELAQYIAPKRKAVEVTGSEGGDIQVATKITFKGKGKAE